MAMNTSEAAASAKNNNTETQCIPYSSQFPAALTRLIGSYVANLQDLEKFAEAILTLGLFPSGACDEDILRRIVREELLPHIFNAAPKEMEEFLIRRCSTPGSLPKMLLTKAGFDEGYFSDTLNKFVCFRFWGNVSAVTAPAFMGDVFYLVLRVLAPLLEADKGRSLSSEEDSYRFQAMRQLQEVEKRITAQTIKDFTLLSEAAKSIVDMYCGKDDVVKQAAERRLEELKKSEEFKRLIEDQSIVEEAIAAGFTPHKDKAKPSITEAEASSTSDQKILSERKVQAEHVPIKYAEDAEFLTPVLRLLKAYINFLVQYPELYAKRDWDKLNYLWEIVGECHKGLFRNVLQEIFDPEKPFTENTPVDFSREPNRGPCVYSNGLACNLNGLGVGTNVGLYKFSLGVVMVAAGSARGGAAVNLGAITPYFKLRTTGTTGLKYIIEQLKTPETAAALVVEYANNGKAAKKG